jgi:uncharacterized spore protein YtfJ
MADNNFTAAVEALFKGMDTFVTTKTVVGDAVKVDDTIILPLVDVTCGMAAGSFAENSKQKGAGGMNAKMSPSAVLIIQNGVTKLVNIKQQDAMTKILDMVPDFVNKFAGGSKEISPDALKVAEEMAASEEEEKEEKEEKPE